MFEKNYHINDRSKKIIRDFIIDGAQAYQSIIGKIFIFIDENNQNYNICFRKKDFLHLIGVSISSKICEDTFFKLALEGKLRTTNISSFQHYNFLTLIKKLKLIKNIDQIVHHKNIIYKNFKTNTTEFPLTIENKTTHMLVSFRLDIKSGLYNARSLRTNSKSGNFPFKIKRLFQRSFYNNNLILIYEEI